MKKNRDKEFRDAFARISTSNLEEILNEELSKRPVNEGAVKMILSELRRRDGSNPGECDSHTEKAWARYLLDRVSWSSKQPSRKNRILKVASIVLIVAALFVMMSQEASARSIFERITIWTDSFFELFSPESKNDNQYEYRFETKHSGLQKVYNKTIELGISGPAVPMWLPEGSELAELKVETYGCYQVLVSIFTFDGDEILIGISAYTDIAPGKYYKSDEPIYEIEIEGIVHYFIRNNDRWTVMWTKENLELMVSAKCSEGEMEKIIESIYVLEE